MLAAASSPSGELDRATLKGAQAGDRAAQAEFVRCYQARVAAAVARMLPAAAHEVEAVAQEAFIKALRALPHFDPDGSARLSSWLITIAVRTALDPRRSAAPATACIARRPARRSSR